MGIKKIRKAVLPLAGLGTRFLPLSQTFPKELWPLLSRPVLDYIVEEAKESGIKEIIFVLSPEKKIILDYFKGNPRLEKILAKLGKKDLLEYLKSEKRKYRGISFSVAWQKKPLGDGDAIRQAKVGREPFAVSFGDDLVFGPKPALAQLMKVFEKYGQPVVALQKVSRDRVSSYGIVEAKKIGPRLYLLKKIVEKPEAKKAPSRLAVVGKYVLTPQVLDFLNRAKAGFRGEVILAQTLKKMIEKGIIIYGYEFEGQWLECGNVKSWLRSNLFLAKKLNLFKK